MSLVARPALNHPQMPVNDEVDDRATTWDVFTPLNDRFHFTVDVAAAHHNAKVHRYYDLTTDGLSQSWARERVWCNPPYSNIAPWVAKANAETEAQTIVMLLPANRTEQRWWQDHIEPHRDNGGRLSIEFLPGRLRFLKRGQSVVGPNERPPFGCCLAIWETRELSLFGATP